MDLSRIKQIDEKIDKTHQQLGESPNASINLQAVYNDVKYLIMMALDAQKEANKLRTKIGRMKITIKKKNDVIRTIDHHNNRLKNYERGAKAALESLHAKNFELNLFLQERTTDGRGGHVVDVAMTHIKKLELENERLREAFENVQDQLFSIRGLDKVHDGEITGLCIEIRKALDGEDIA